MHYTTSQHVEPSLCCNSSLAIKVFHTHTHTFTKGRSFHCLMCHQAATSRLWQHRSWTWILWKFGWSVQCQCHWCNRCGQSVAVQGSASVAPSWVDPFSDGCCTPPGSPSSHLWDSTCSWKMASGCLWPNQPQRATPAGCWCPTGGCACQSRPWA